MMPPFRQQLIQQRTLWGAVTLFCLLWHILLPSIVHIGLVPALFVMPSHCQPAVVSSEYTNAGSQYTGADNGVKGITQRHSGLSDYSTKNALKQMQMSAALDQGSGVTSGNAIFHTQHAQEVFALAMQIMKHCPLCSHGLDSGVIIPLIALMFVLLLQCFAVIRSLADQWIKPVSLTQISFALPFKHGPPATL